MEQLVVVGESTDKTNAIPRWIGWAHVVLLPVTTFWLTLYSFPILLCYLLWILVAVLAVGGVRDQRLYRLPPLEGPRRRAKVGGHFVWRGPAHDPPTDQQVNVEAFNRKK